MKRIFADGFALIFALALLGVLFAGCVQSSAPQACAGASQGTVAACTYEQAVLEQNPFYCYSLSDMAARQTCMRDATDPVVKKQLENSKSRGAQIAQQPATVVEAPAAPSTPPAQPNASCDAMNGTARDECIRAQSVADADLLGCVRISGQSAKMACVSQIAQSTRDLASCANLQDSALRDLCRTYAKGETPSS